MSLKLTLIPNTAWIEAERFQRFFEIHASDGLPATFDALVIGVSPRFVVALKTCAG